MIAMADGYVSLVDDGEPDSPYADNVFIVTAHDNSYLIVYGHIKQFSGTNMGWQQGWTVHAGQKIAEVGGGNAGGQHGHVHIEVHTPLNSTLDHRYENSINPLTAYLATGGTVDYVTVWMPADGSDYPRPNYSVTCEGFDDGGVDVEGFWPPVENSDVVATICAAEGGGSAPLAVGNVLAVYEVQLNRWSSVHGNLVEEDCVRLEAWRDFDTSGSSSSVWGQVYHPSSYGGGSSAGLVRLSYESGPSTSQEYIQAIATGPRGDVVLWESDLVTAVDDVTNLAAIATGWQKVTVSWDATGTPPGTMSVLRSINGGLNYVNVANVEFQGNGQYSYVDTDVATQVRHYYYIAYENQQTDPVWVMPSAPAPASVPSVPAFEVLTIGAQQASLQITSGASETDRYFVHWGTTPGPPYDNTIEIDDPRDEVLLQGLVTDATYYVSVRAENLLGYSGYAPETQLQALQAPLGLSAAAWADALFVSWLAVPNVTFYQVDVFDVTTGFPTPTTSATVSSNNTVLWISGLTSDRMYQVSVASVDGEGNVTESGDAVALWADSRVWPDDLVYHVGPTGMWDEITLNVRVLDSLGQPVIGTTDIEVWPAHDINVYHCETPPFTPTVPTDNDGWTTVAISQVGGCGPARFSVFTEGERLSGEPVVELRSADTHATAAAPPTDRPDGEVALIDFANFSPTFGAEDPCYDW